MMKYSFAIAALAFSASARRLDATAVANAVFTASSATVDPDSQPSSDPVSPAHSDAGNAPGSESGDSSSSDSGSSAASGQSPASGSSSSNQWIQCEVGWRGCDPATWGPMNQPDYDYEICYYVPHDYVSNAHWSTDVTILNEEQNIKHIFNREKLHITINTMYMNRFYWSLDEMDALPKGLMEDPDFSDVNGQLGQDGDYHFHLIAIGCHNEATLNFTGKAPASAPGVDQPADAHSTLNVRIGSDPYAVVYAQNGYDLN